MRLACRVLIAANTVAAGMPRDGFANMASWTEATSSRSQRSTTASRADVRFSSNSGVNPASSPAFLHQVEIATHDEIEPPGAPFAIGVAHQRRLVAVAADQRGWTRRPLDGLEDEA